jgi:anti-sigma-K factor RskA
MNWYRNPSAIDLLAAAYVAGTLQGRARRRFENVMQGQPALATAVNQWTARLAPLYGNMKPQAPSAGLWRRIAASTTTPITAGPTTWWQRLLAPLPAGALALGLMMGAVLPVLWQAPSDLRGDMQLPDSYVGVLATAQGQPGLILSSLRSGKVVDIKQVTPVAVAPGHTLYLWRIDKAGAVAALGPLANGPWTHMALDEPAEQLFFTAVELAVSVEPLGTQPRAPTQPFVYRGLCGKLWR